MHPLWNDAERAALHLPEPMYEVPCSPKTTAKVEMAN